MVIQAAEECFQKGLKAMGKGRHREALALFEAALEVERRLSADKPQARYLSYYGLCLALDQNEVHGGLHFCREAVSFEGFNPDIRCNIGRVLIKVGRRREAHQHFACGLSLQPGHKAIVSALKRMGMRRRPPLPFLARGNPINVLLGKVRARPAA